MINVKIKIKLTINIFGEFYGKKRKEHTKST